MHIFAIYLNLTKFITLIAVYLRVRMIIIQSELICLHEQPFVNFRVCIQGVVQNFNPAVYNPTVTSYGDVQLMVQHFIILSFCHAFFRICCETIGFYGNSKIRNGL